ncbi:MAG: alpha-ketoglutarate-dependent dioxygenase AlkB [Flavisolibacter sp.]
MMHTLFPLDDIYPEGFSYHENFITPEEETYYLESAKLIELHTFKFQGFEAKRKLASFGYDYHFDQRGLTKGKDIPALFDPLIKKLANLARIPTQNFAELLITEYPPGALINWHRDAPPFELIAGISLGADCIFKLRPHNKQLQTRNTTISIPVNRRSVYIMKGDARSEWQHRTAPVNNTRYSITIRTLKSQHPNDVKK